MEIDYVITVCDHARQICPIFPGGKEIIHKGFDDPAALSGDEEDTLALFRRLRDEIQGWIKEFFGKEDHEDFISHS